MRGWLRSAGGGLGAGSALLLALVANRLATPELLNAQSRADLIAVAAPVFVALEALTRLDITPKEADQVQLSGQPIHFNAPSLDQNRNSELEWATQTICDCLRCSSLAILHREQTLLLRGRFATGAAAEPELQQLIVPGPILKKCMQSKSGAPDYLPALQLLPGRIEFGYFPEETQGVLILPFDSGRGAVIIGADRVRQFKASDIEWTRAVVSRIASSVS